MSQTYRVAIVGLGYISDFHLRTIRRRKALELVALCDLNATALAAKAAAIPGVATYTDIRQMLCEESIDVVHILTQPDSHFMLARLALEAGSHVILEKPATVDLDQAVQLKTRADECGLRVAVNHNFLFSRPFNALAETLASGRLGPLKSVRAVWKRPLPPIYSGPWNLWMLRNSGNIVFETGSHPISQVLAACGGLQIDSVEPYRTLELASGVPFHRRWLLHGHHDDTAIRLEWSFDRGYDQHCIEVEGQFGVAVADIENDVFALQAPTGSAYDMERLRLNAGLGRSRLRQALATYGSYVGAKFSRFFDGAPYESSMDLGIDNCYREIEGSSARAESGLDFAIEVAKVAEAIVAQLPPGEAPHSDRRVASVPVVETPTQDADYLITGATGFIGKKLTAALLARGSGVRILVRNPSALQGVELPENCEVMAGDYRDRELAAKALSGVRRVVHLAVSHGNSLAAYMAADSDPTIAFARQCLDAGVERFVYTGTIDSLSLDRRAALRESDGVDPRIARRNNYAHSKAITERRLHELRDQSGLPLVVVRPAIVIGEGGPLEHLGVANWNGLGRCVYWGHGTNPLPFVLVDDVVAGIIAAAETPAIEGRTYNLAAESTLSARDYVEAISSSAGIKVHATSSSAVVSYLGDLLKWSAKLLVGHPDARRLPSLHDWRCRQQHASFDTNNARVDLGWRPESDRDALIERGISVPARLARDL